MSQFRFTPGELELLRRAGFTDKQISDHGAKFESLFRVSPLMRDEMDRLLRYDRERADLRRAAEAAIDAMLKCYDDMRRAGLHTSGVSAAIDELSAVVEIMK